jgi:hypothetical protein
MKIEHSGKPDSAIHVGVSQCLLGENVRIDNGHKRDPFLTDMLSRYFTWVSVCPEVELGMGTPAPRSGSWKPGPEFPCSSQNLARISPSP